MSSTNNIIKWINNHNISSLKMWKKAFLFFVALKIHWDFSLWLSVVIKTFHGLFFFCVKLLNFFTYFNSICTQTKFNFCCIFSVWTLKKMFSCFFLGSISLFSIRLKNYSLYIYILGILFFFSYGKASDQIHREFKLKNSFQNRRYSLSLLLFLVVSKCFHLLISILFRTMYFDVQFSWSASTKKTFFSLFSYIDAQE